MAQLVIRRYGKLPKRRVVAYGRGNTSRTIAYQRPMPRDEPADPIGPTSLLDAEARAGDEEAGPFAIHGLPASDLEWRMYRILKELGWSDANIEFRSDMLGGRRIGGVEIDFVLYGLGVLYAIQVNGDHWHKYGPQHQKTLAQEALITEAVPGAIVVALYTADLLDDDIARSTLRRLVGRGA